MPDFLKVRCLSAAEEKKLLADVDARIAAKKKEGLLTDREVREIEEMKLHPLPDIQDVQNIYENHLYTNRD